MSEKDYGNLKAILDAIRKIKVFTSDFSGVEEFYSDEKSFDATLLNFVIIGEL